MFKRCAIHFKLMVVCPRWRIWQYACTGQSVLPQASPSGIPIACVSSMRRNSVLIGSGASDMISVSIRSNLLQTVTPTHLFGRVSAVNSVFVGSSNEIGMFESGVTAQWFGTVPSVVLGGAATLVVVATVFGRNKALRGLRRIHELGDWSDDNATSPRRE